MQVVLLVFSVFERCFGSTPKIREDLDKSEDGVLVFIHKYIETNEERTQRKRNEGRGQGKAGLR